MGDDKPEGSTRIFTRPSQRQRLSNVGLATSMGLKPNSTPIWKVVCLLILLTVLSRSSKEELPRPHISFTKCGKPMVKYLEAITKKKVHKAIIVWYVHNDGENINENLLGIFQQNEGVD